MAAVRLPLKNDIYTGFISFNAGMAKTIRSKFEQNYRISCHSLFFGKGRLKKLDFVITGPTKPRGSWNRGIADKTKRLQVLDVD